MKLLFRESAARQMRKLDRPTRIRILKKLQFYLAQSNPLKFAERLEEPRFGSGRFHIGDYRIFFDVEKNKIIVLKVGHRREVYR